MSSKRGCGSKQHDCLYFHYPLGAGGIPLKYLTICPIWVIDREKLGISFRGMTPIKRLDTAGQVQLNDAGHPIIDVFDVVGREHYPFKADFYEEARRMGIDRKVSSRFPFDILTRGESRHYLCTNAGSYHIDDIEAIRNKINQNSLHTHECLKGYPEHRLPLQDRLYEVCSSMWWDEIPQSYCKLIGGDWYRTGMPWGDYPVSANPPKQEPRWIFGVFMALPIMGLLATTPKGEVNLSDDIKGAVDRSGLTYKVVNL